MSSIDRVDLWILRFAVLPPIVIALLIGQFESSVSGALDKTRSDLGMLPFQSVSFKLAFDIWKLVPVVCSGILLASFFVPRLVSPAAAAVGYGVFSVLLAWQLFWGCLVILAFVR
jgi:hypothetical protein